METVVDWENCSRRFFWCFKFCSKKNCSIKSLVIIINELPHDKTNKMACAPSKHSDQPGHPPSLIRVFAVRMKKAWVLSYPLSAQQRLWSDWADAQANLSLRLAHSHTVGFVMRRLKSLFTIINDVKILWKQGWKKKIHSSAHHGEYHMLKDESENLNVANVAYWIEFTFWHVGGVIVLKIFQPWESTVV